MRRTFALIGAAAVAIAAFVLVPATAKPTPPAPAYSPEYQVVTTSRELPPGAVVLRAQCPEGKTVTGGGYTYDGNGIGKVVISESYPEPVTQSWLVMATLDSSAPGPVLAGVYAVCARTR